MRRIKSSFAVRLSLRFMFILTTSIILLSVALLFFVRSLVKANQTEELEKAEHAVSAILGQMYGMTSFEDSDFFQIRDLPYYLTYIAYDPDTENVLATNDPFLPLLKDSEGKAVHHFEKDFFLDGDLDILYYADTHILEDFWTDKTQKVVVAVAMNMENDSFARILLKLPLALLVMALPVLLISFFVSLFITKNTIHPVVKITKAAKTMTTENLDGQLPLTGRGDEIDELSKTFNDLFRRIKADFDRERQFSSDVSHELNTPLTVISGQANLLLRWGKDNPEQLEKSLNAIKNESKSMHAIIENLLQISRIESGRIKPQVCEVDVNELLARVSEEIKTFAVGAKVEVECQAGLKIQTDTEMLHQVLTVLVSNSAKFAGGECTVKLSAGQAEDGRIMICESDDGPGISEEAQPHVFERFYRADEAHTRAAGGSGLGLAIAKTLCEALGAEITAGNVEPHGALFTLKF